MLCSEPQDSLNALEHLKIGLPEDLMNLFEYISEFCIFKKATVTTVDLNYLSKITSPFNDAMQFDVMALGTEMVLVWKVIDFYSTKELSLNQDERHESRA